MTFPFDPKSILFSLSTICDVIPETDMVPAQGGRSPFYLHEDDWRQVEFVAGTDVSQVEREMAALEAFKRANWTGAGWKSVYIRKERPDGLASKRLPSTLIDEIPHGPMHDLMIGTPPRVERVKGGFAADLGESVVIYGRHFQNDLLDLCLTQLPREDASTVVQNVLGLCRTFELRMVDWCGGLAIGEPSAT